MAATRARDHRIDTLRGLAMVAVVVNHGILAASAHTSPVVDSVKWSLVSAGMANSGVWVDRSAYFNPTLNIAYTFHVALFAFAGGLLIKSEGTLAAFTV